MPLHKYQVQLTNMVPYRALAGFFKNAEVRPYWDDRRGMTDLIHQVNEVCVFTAGLKEPEFIDGNCVPRRDKQIRKMDN